MTGADKFSAVVGQRPETKTITDCVFELSTFPQRELSFWLSPNAVAAEIRAIRFKPQSRSLGVISRMFKWLTQPIHAEFLESVAVVSGK
jgi:hypothetical protein